VQNYTFFFDKIKEKQGFSMGNIFKSFVVTDKNAKI
jgi:aminopeptidase C